VFGREISLGKLLNFRVQTIPQMAPVALTLSKQFASLFCRLGFDAPLFRSRARKEIDELYQNNPYYIVPDGEVGQQAFAVIREAIRQEGMVAIGKVVFTSREHIIALEARGKGMMGMTLRYPYEVRKESEYFDDIADEKIPKDMLELASHIVESKAGHFKPEKFEDQYEDALKELLKKKQSGQKIEAPRDREPSKVVNLMDALRRSVETERGGGERRKPARASDHRAPKKAGRSSAQDMKKLADGDKYLSKLERPRCVV
jgi:DNA end-binding protein Ku